MLQGTKYGPEVAEGDVLLCMGLHPDVALGE